MQSERGEKEAKFCEGGKVTAKSLPALVGWKRAAVLGWIFSLRGAKIRRAQKERCLRAPGCAFGFPLVLEWQQNWRCMVLFVAWADEPHRL